MVGVELLLGLPAPQKRRLVLDEQALTLELVRLGVRQAGWKALGEDLLVLERAINDNGLHGELESLRGALSEPQFVHRLQVFHGCWMAGFCAIAQEPCE